MKITPNQLLALKRGRDDLSCGSLGFVRADRSTLGGLIKKGLVRETENVLVRDVAFITQAGINIIDGKTPFKLWGKSTYEPANVEAEKLARTIAHFRR